ncbi:MAG: flagellar basal body rod protein FlgB [Pseudomonadota bacterium]|nr:flagellar basal body rod protein FlgB [Alphaproteobacteria bacterium]MEC7701371.1 flagellar basal body rod protein FlgB [Pseudomonadota bacterium]MED5423540.1 flagellar basal body rod protein FlgB [Pseudomonadota bacterium]MEE3323248.1 flagellar basal body rod protein FlgB [Pseudomonadota bacterium]|tara:strand:- start:231 stop:644 length:414 start_codon:yes stop_codon:yes gene_type:complete
MTIENLALFKAAGAKMKYLNARQQVIAQNIANADTANYIPKDLTEVDFGRVLAKVSGDNRVNVSTSMGSHMTSRNQIGDIGEEQQQSTYEVTPSGNAVNLDEQLVKSNQVQMDYNMMLNLMRKQVGMMKTAIGAGKQ